MAVLLPTALGYAVVGARRIFRHLGNRGAAGPSRRPIDGLSADLRRLHALVEKTENTVGVPAKNIRCQAARAAYLDALLVACRELEIPPPEGRPVARSEIYRVESDLRRRGLDVRAVR
ncbi:MAG: hypothetical protein ABR571_00855 [Jatrophihabitans sp.]|uniref:hypothetical protein n=1 Tax=Jatrophihabitans sp. TaxID=1932789 RepID=UPI0039162A2F